MNKIIFKFFTLTLAITYTPIHADPAQTANPLHHVQHIQKSNPVLFLAQKAHGFFKQPCIKKTLTVSKNFASAATDWRTYYSFGTQHRKKILLVSSSALAAYGVYSLISYWRAYNQAVAEKEACKKYYTTFCQSLRNNLDNYCKLKNCDSVSDELFKIIEEKVAKKFCTDIGKAKESARSALIANTKQEDIDYLFSLEELEDKTSSQKFRDFKFFKSHLFEALKTAVAELS